MSSNLYVEARREWDERYADLVLGKRNWQIAAGGLLILSLVVAAGFVWISNRSRYIPYIVEVDKLGYALTVPQPLTPSAVPDVTARMERYEIATFIRGARSVTTDRRSNIRRSMPYSRTPAARRTDSSTRITTPTNSRITHSNLPRSRRSQFRLILFFNSLRTATRCDGPRCQHDLNGIAISAPTHWEAVLQTQIVPPNSDDAIVSNPLGFYVTQISWTEQQS